MNYAKTDTIIAKSYLDNLKIYPGETGAGSCTFSGNIARERQNECYTGSIEAFKGFAIAALLSLPFWLSIAYLLAF